MLLFEPNEEFLDYTCSSCVQHMFNTYLIGFSGYLDYKVNKPNI